jgi:phage gpG-like protein
MIRLIAEIDGDRQFDRSFTRFTENLRDFRQLWPGVITTLRRIVKEQFAGQGIGPSGPWKPLSKAYGEWKKKSFPGKPIMQRSGALIEALTKNTSDSIVDAKPDYLEFGSSLPYANYHQSRLPRKRLPRRPVFDLTEENKTRLTKAIQARLVKAGRENGVTIS